MSIPGPGSSPTPQKEGGIYTEGITTAYALSYTPNLTPMKLEEELERGAEFYSLMARAMGYSESQLEALPDLLLIGQHSGNPSEVAVKALLKAAANVRAVHPDVTCVGSMPESSNRCLTTQRLDTQIRCSRQVSRRCLSFTSE
jgi:hypothetical protein